MAKRKYPVLLTLLVASISPASAYAYLDPGTGSFILQMLVAGFLAAWLYVKIAWTNTKLFFSRLFSSEPPAEETKEDDSEKRELQEAEKESTP